MKGEAGFSLIEALVGAAILGIVSLVGATLMSNLGTSKRYLSAEAANVELTQALREITARRTTCAASMIGRPAAYSGSRAVAIRISGGSSSVVQAGATLPDLGLVVTALDLKNFAAAGTADNGNPVFLGDLTLTTKSIDPTVTPFREITVSRVALETQGAGLVACYASDLYQDTTQLMQAMCGRIVSPEGIPSTYAGGRCVVRDNNIAATCAQMGGGWDGSRCVIRHSSFIISRYVPPGAHNDGTGYGVYCPGGTVLTGGACTSTSPPRIPMNGMYLGGGLSNYYGCAWQSGYEDTGYNVYAACLR